MNNRMLLDADRIHPAALDAIGAFHADVVREVADAVAREPIVVVGMRQNPFCRKARAALDKAGLTYRYLEYGSYFSGWKPRLAIKLWSGWPTYPQVFVRGRLVGGYEDVVPLLERGELQQLLQG